MEAEYFTGLDATYSQNKGHGYRGNKKIGEIWYLLEPCMV